MAHLGLSMIRRPGTPPNHSKAWRWQASQVAELWSRTISTYWCRDQHSVITKNQVLKVSPVRAWVIAGPAPKSTCAASPGLKSSRSGTSGADSANNWLTNRCTEE